MFTGPHLALGPQVLHPFLETPLTLLRSLTCYHVQSNRYSVLNVRGMNKSIGSTFASQQTWDILQAQRQIPVFAKTQGTCAKYGRSQMNIRRKRDIFSILGGSRRGIRAFWKDISIVVCERYKIGCFINAFTCVMLNATFYGCGQLLTLWTFCAEVCSHLEEDQVNQPLDTISIGFADVDCIVLH